MKKPAKRTTEPSRRRSLIRILAVGGLLSMLCIVLLLAFGFNFPFAGAVADQAEAEQRASAKRPVILLTGFEPFGRGRPPNPSWEGIKNLDGTEWRGYQLACKQLPVVWGAPLEHLRGWIAEYQPVAVFSFGQGGPRSFALESKAHNDRRLRSEISIIIGATGPCVGSGTPTSVATLAHLVQRLRLDNRNELPSSPTIVADGPSQFDASIDCEEFVHLLSEKGYPIRVSTNAGRYLCEEALYSLEYLKTSQDLKATVMFCHVPPLKTTIADQTVTPEYVGQFVKDTLETWYTLYQGDATPVAAQANLNQPMDPRQQQEIKEFVGRYFRTWSDQDMKGYDACFMPDASIQQIDARGRLTTLGRKEFIATQRDYHRSAPHRTTETPEAIDIRMEGKLARAVVYWKLVAGPRTEFGYDHFTLMKHEGNWRIINLVFYGTD